MRVLLLLLLILLHGARVVYNIEIAVQVVNHNRNNVICRYPYYYYYYIDCGGEWWCVHLQLIMRGRGRDPKLITLLLCSNRREIKWRFNWR